MKKHDFAIAFDFDGTLIKGGRFNNDKAIHIMYAAWVACAENGFGAFLQPGKLRSDVFHMARAFARYPGSPRFQQLAAVVNALVNRRYDAPAEFKGLGMDKRCAKAWERVRARYNEIYSALNAAAAEKYWKPYPSAKKTLRALARQYDLHIASGITKDILENDFAHHHFDRRLFQRIEGGNVRGGNDKAEILRNIKSEGYAHVLFAGDSYKDCQYAREAGVNFYRIREDGDFPRLVELLKHRLPNRRGGWSYTREEMDFIRNKTLHLIERYCNGKAMTPEQVTRYVNS